MDESWVFGIIVLALVALEVLACAAFVSLVSFLIVRRRLRQHREAKDRLPGFEVIAPGET